MRKASRILGAFLALALIAAACGDSSDSTAPADSAATTTAAPAATTAAPAATTAAPDTTPDATEAPDPTEPEAMVYQIGLIHNGRGDGSFNDSAVLGYDRALTDFGIEQTEVVVNLTGGETGIAEVSLLGEVGTDLGIGIGFLLFDAVAEAAAAFPETKWAIVDSVVDAPNVANLVFAEEQGSFLVGAAAAMTSSSGKVGFIGGVDTVLIKKFEAGFVAGALAVNPDVEVEVKYISQSPDFSGFGDPVKAKEIAIGQIDGGVDVIYSAAGGSGNGMFEAVREANEAGTVVWSIGVDSDQASPSNVAVPDEVKPYILTSMLKRVDLAVFETISALIDGTLVFPSITVFDLSVDGVGYSTTNDHMTADQIAQIEDFKAQIISGAITVPAAP
jgi:basic membrane protein A